MEEVKETQPKKKGTAKTKKQKDTEETILENNEVAPVEESAPVEEAPVEEAPVEESAPVEEAPVEEAPKPEPVEQPKEDAKPKTETTAKKSVPTIAELRKMRKFNESIFKFDDGFACTATSQRTANAKHNDWLAGE